jgi:hypothetical protein
VVGLEGVDLGIEIEEELWVGLLEVVVNRAGFAVCNANNGVLEKILGRVRVIRDRDIGGLRRGLL